MSGGPSPGVSAIEVRLAAGCPQPRCRSQRFDLPGTLRRRARRDPPMIRTAVFPELPSSLDRIDAGVLPPGGFIAYAVHQSMMDAPERHRELSLALRPKARGCRWCR
jgi:hypothetical protein